jgi:excisionase family DNA binding protein
VSSKKLDPRSDLDVVAVARQLTVNPRTVSRWLQHGKLRGYRLGPGGKYRVPQAAVQAFLERRLVPKEPRERESTQQAK